MIFTASLLSTQGGVFVPGYTASKSALAGLVRALSNEWAGHGVNVNGIAPGYIATDNTEALRADPERSRAILERIPAGRWGEPRHLAGVTLFLASQASDYVCGALIPVDGGWLHGDGGDLDAVCAGRIIPVVVLDDARAPPPLPRRCPRAGCPAPR